MLISYRPATAADAPAISRLIHSLSGFIEDRSVHPDSDSYFDTITPEAILDRITAPGFIYLVAEDSRGICGVAGLRDARHLYHLFVREELHRQGVARELWKRLMHTSSSTFFTVNSSLFAVPVYIRLGFVKAGEEQCRKGVTIQPMVYTQADQNMVPAVENKSAVGS